VVLANSDARSRSSLQSSLADEPEVAAGEDKFDWWKQWYPVAVERDMDPTTPHKVSHQPLCRRDTLMTILRTDPACGNLSGLTDYYDCFLYVQVTLLARDLVLWKDGNEKKWRCFIDRYVMCYDPKCTSMTLENPDGMMHTASLQLPSSPSATLRRPDRATHGPSAVCLPRLGMGREGGLHKDPTGKPPSLLPMI
jgi:hypothetical protein